MKHLIAIVGLASFLFVYVLVLDNTNLLAFVLEVLLIAYSIWFARKYVDING